MAIFSKTTEEETKPVEAGEIEVKADGTAVVAGNGRKQVMVLPRLSEKANSLAKLNQFVFKVTGGKINKIELKKTIESFYGVKIANINTVAVKGKYRRYGRTYGRTSDFKKAIVTLTADSKQPDLVEQA